MVASLQPPSRYLRFELILTHEVSQVYGPLLADVDVIVLLFAHAAEVFEPVAINVLVYIAKVIQLFEFAVLLLVRQVFAPVVDRVDEFIRGLWPQFELHVRVVDLEDALILN